MELCFSDNDARRAMNKDRQNMQHRYVELFYKQNEGRGGGGGGNGGGFGGGNGGGFGMGNNMGGRGGGNMGRGGMPSAYPGFSGQY